MTILLFGLISSAIAAWRQRQRKYQRKEAPEAGTPDGSRQGP